MTYIGIYQKHKQYIQTTYIDTSVTIADDHMKKCSTNHQRNANQEYSEVALHTYHDGSL